MASTSTPVWTIGSLLAWTADFFAKKEVDEARLSAELLLAHALKCSRMALYTQYEKVPGEAELVVFRALVKERANHVPVAYLIGKAWFFSLELEVTRDVLIPRADTETVVEHVLQQARVRTEWASAAILDLCTGSGAIAIALAKRMASATFTGVDISERALAVARKNADLHKVADRVTFLAGDLFEPLEKMPAPTLFDVITANPPYIPTAEISRLPATVRDFEPRVALDGGADGMDFHRRILEGAKGHLKPGGMLIMEMQFDQGAGLEGAYVAAGFGGVRVVRDAAGHPRCVVGTRE